MAAAGAAQPGSATSVSRPSATGCCGSMPKVLPVSSAARRQARDPNSLQPNAGTLCGWSSKGLSRGSPGRAEEHDQPPLGQARHPPLSAERPEDGVGRHLRGHLPSERQGRRPGAAPLHHTGHEPATGRDRPGCHARRPCRAAPRSSRVACLNEAAGAQQHHACAAAVLCAGACMGRPVSSSMSWCFLA
jgi:hypothetical protein